MVKFPSFNVIKLKFYFFVSVVMHKDKEDSTVIHRQRELTAFDHTPLDGEMFLQVSEKLDMNYSS